MRRHYAKNTEGKSLLFNRDFNIHVIGTNMFLNELVIIMNCKFCFHTGSDKDTATVEFWPDEYIF